MPEIKAFLIFEMLGRPAEHLKKTLIEFTEKLDKELGIKIINKKINEPKKIEDAKEELYTSFAETEIEFKDINSLLRIVFVYMPSHVEITNPEEIRIKNFDLTSLMSELARKLHQYDEIAKGLMIERSILQRQLEQQGIKPAIPQATQQQQAQQVKKSTKKKQTKKSKKVKKRR